MAGGRPRIYTTEEYKVRASKAQVSYRRRIQVLVNDYKMSKGCAQCGYNKHPYALQFDHINQINNREKSRPRYGSDGSVLRAESLKSLDKVKTDTNIQVLCGNCHNIKSNTERYKND